MILATNRATTNNAIANKAWTLTSGIERNKDISRTINLVNSARMSLVYQLQYYIIHEYPVRPVVSTGNDDQRQGSYYDYQQKNDLIGQLVFMFIAVFRQSRITP